MVQSRRFNKLSDKQFIESLSDLAPGSYSIYYRGPPHRLLDDSVPRQFGTKTINRFSWLTKPNLTV